MVTAMPEPRSMSELPSTSTITPPPAAVDVDGQGGADARAAPRRCGGPAGPRDCGPGMAVTRRRSCGRSAAAGQGRSSWGERRAAGRARDVDFSANACLYSCPDRTTCSGPAGGRRAAPPARRRRPARPRARRSRGRRRALDRPVRWVAVSELEDPAPVPRGRRAAAHDGDAAAGEDRGVRGVRRSGSSPPTSSGSASGVGLSHATGARRARGRRREGRACRCSRCPSARRSSPSPRPCRGLLAAEEYDEAARGFAAQRDLIRAALSADDGGAAAVVARLAKHVGGFALVPRPGGRRACTRARPSAARARRRPRRRDRPAAAPQGCSPSAVVSGADDYVVIQPLGVRGRARGLPRGRRRRDRCAPTTRRSSTSRCRCCRCRSRGPRDARAAERGVRAAALRLLLDGRAAEPAARARSAGRACAAAPVRVLVARPAAPTRPAWPRPRTGWPRRCPGAAVAAGLVADDPSLVVAVVTGAARPRRRCPAAGTTDVLACVGVGDGADARRRRRASRAR